MKTRVPFGKNSKTILHIKTTFKPLFLFFVVFFFLFSWMKVRDIKFKLYSRLMEVRKKQRRSHLQSVTNRISENQPYLSDRINAQVLKKNKFYPYFLFLFYEI